MNILNRYVLMEEAGTETAAGDPPTEAAPTSEPTPPPPPDWKSTLSRELQDSPSLQDVPDLETLVKNYENTKAMVGNSIRLPTEEAGQEAVDAVVQKILDSHLPLMKKPDLENAESLEDIYKVLGRPDEVSGYSVPEEVDGEIFGSMSEKAFELGLSRRQYEGMAQALAAQQMAEFEQHETQRSQGVAQLKGEWGPAFDQKVGRGAQVAEALGAPQALIEALKSGTANAEAIRFMDNIANQIGHEGSQIAQQIGQVTESTVSDIQQRIADRTKRMLSESIPRQEYEDLMKRNIADHEKLASYRKS